MEFKIEVNAEGHHRLLAVEAVRAGDVMCAFDGRRDTKPNRYTVQIGEHEHIWLEPQLLQYINHSCEPNVAFDTAAMKLRALREIAAGDELFYFYPSTEWDMEEKFECNCGTASCLKQIQGAKHLSADAVARYAFMPHIRALLAV